MSETIKETKAGRELDKIVAREVMGHRKVRDTSWFGGAKVVSPAETVSIREYVMPKYSTTMGGGWAVVNEMERRGFWLRLLSPFEAGGNYSAGFTPMGTTGWNGRPDYEDMGETPELAICRAALKAVRESHD